MAAEQVLARRAGGDQAHAQVGQVDERERLDQRLERALQPAGGGRARRPAGRAAEPASRRRARGRTGRRGGRAAAEQPQRGVEPAGGDRRRAGGGLAAGLLEHGDGRLVADLRRALEVVRARGQRARPVGERGGGARVRLQPPRLAGAVVDRAAHERVAEAVAARDVGRRRRCRRPAARRARPASRARPGRRRRPRGRGRTARPPPRRPSRAAGPAPAGRRSPGRARRATAGGTPTRSPSAPGSAAAGAGARAQLLEVERVAAALAVDRRQRPAAPSSASGLGLGQRPEPDSLTSPSRAACVERGQQAVGHLPGAEGERDQHGRRRRAAQQVRDQLERGVVGPVHVVEHEHDGLAHRQPLQQRADRAVGVEALVLQAARGRAGRRRRGQHARELGHAVADQRLQLALAERARRGRRARRPRSANGSSRSSSAPRPTNTACRRSAARSASWPSSRVLPIPGSPLITSQRARRAAQAVRARPRSPPAPGGARRTASAAPASPSPPTLIDPRRREQACQPHHRVGCAACMI